MRIDCKIYLACISIVFICSSCAISRRASDPHVQFTAEELRSDYKLFRNILEESHPSLYWFTPRDSMDYYFDFGFAAIKDSMNERDFRTLLTYVAAKIRCGHTSLRYSKTYSGYLDTAKLKAFPLRLKFLENDTVVITGNLFFRDSILGRGTLLTSVNAMPIELLRDTLFHYITGDGNSRAGKYQSLSNAGNFGVLYKNLFGLPEQFNIGYVDSTGIEKHVTIPVFDPDKDSVFRSSIRNIGRYTTRERREQDRFATRNLQVDTSLSSAYLTLNTFARGNGLKGFFRRSFRNIRRLNLQNLVIDVRGNGGGDAGNSTLLTEYLADRPFKVADSLYATRRGSKYSKHIKLQPIYWLMMSIVTTKRSDGNYHFGFFERKAFKPKRKNHFDGNIYILTGGNSFSATTIFAQSLKGQKNVTIVGEETGGGAYGNTAWMIPEVRLPNTGIRFTLPKFRLVMKPELVAEGRGVMPDVQVSPTVLDIRRGIDSKVEMVRRLISRGPAVSSRE